MYTTNPKHFSLLHNIPTDIVEVCGGSRLLIKMLNQLGCTCSADSHNRFVTERAEEMRQKNAWNELPSNVFTIASVDNFDMLRSHMSVYCGSQQRSYHGTTVQLVQPNDKLQHQPLTQAVEVSTCASSLPSTHTLLDQLSDETSTYLINSPLCLQYQNVTSHSQNSEAANAQLSTSILQ